MDDEQVNVLQPWEEEYKKSWDILKEDDQGTLTKAVHSINQLKLAKRRLLKDSVTLQRGIIRHVVVLVDCSKAMADQDLRPNRLECTLGLTRDFINEFFIHNPLSMLMVVGIRDGLAERWSEWSGNPVELIKQLKSREHRTVLGDSSLQNGLDLCHQALQYIPNHISREIVTLYGSLSTCDPNDISVTIQKLKLDRVRVSFIGLSAQIKLCQIIAAETNGVYDIVINESHYKDLLFSHIPPPPLSNNSSFHMIQMGFPILQEFDHMILCSCHQRLIKQGQLCPKCKSIVCEIPRDCPVCSLTLVSSPSLTRSYHHLFPVSVFQEKKGLIGGCFGCSSDFEGQNGVGYQCLQCHHSFCFECDVYIHEGLYNCPGCLC